MAAVIFYDSGICSVFVSQAVIFQYCPRLLGVYLAKPEKTYKIWYSKQPAPPKSYWKG